ncbi:hypothetical protein GBAR_LOCUS19048 [Geodia barretti]|uniref:Uncharacterized protein n=1 Tax=Geodia barretti TaxID=519541 RepID=A0AA35SR64_GEOBA|nr:hypothetical protein GBAR_LOCUS19048 [Geodia barretti]
MMGHSADLTSTLSTQANDIVNGTNVSCLIFSDSRSITILKEAPLPPVVTIVSYALTFSVLFVVTWAQPQRVPVSRFIISTSNTQPVLIANTTNYTIESDYNTKLTYNFSSYNCFGTSESITKEFFMGKFNVIIPNTIKVYTSSWLWSSQSTSEWQCW